MGRKKKDVFVHQLKTVQDIEDRIKVLIDTHRGLKAGKLGVMFRTVIDPNGPTIYEKGHHGKGSIFDGVRECDFEFSTSDPSWIMPNRKKGLSFSSTVKHTVGTMKFLGGFQKKGTKISCAYWILEDNEAIPEDMEFVQDPDNAEHYLLCITKKMHLNELVSKLTFISQRMAVMNDLALEAYKNA